jgi:hypothetical protein
MYFQAYLAAKHPAIILPVVSYWWKEHRLKVFDSRMLKKILGLKWEGETRDWNKSHEEEIHDSFLDKYYYGNQTQEGEIKEACGIRVCGGIGGKMHIEFWWGNSRERDSEACDMC